MLNLDADPESSSGLLSAYGGSSVQGDGGGGNPNGTLKQVQGDCVINCRVSIFHTSQQVQAWKMLNQVQHDKLDYKVMVTNSTYQFMVTNSIFLSG